MSEFINKFVSFLLCEFNCVTSRKKQKYFYRTFIFSNPQIEILVSFSRATNVNVNMSLPNNNFEGNFSSYVFGKSFWHYRDPKSECWTSRHTIYKKILNFSYVCRLEFFVKKWNMYESHIFPGAITTNMLIGNDSFVFKYTVTIKQKISKFTLILLKLM